MDFHLLTPDALDALNARAKSAAPRKNNSENRSSVPVAACAPAVNKGPIVPVLLGNNSAAPAGFSNGNGTTVVQRGFAEDSVSPPSSSLPTKKNDMTKDSVSEPRVRPKYCKNWMKTLKTPGGPRCSTGDVCAFLHPQVNGQGTVLKDNHTGRVPDVRELNQGPRSFSSEAPEAAFTTGGLGGGSLNALLRQATLQYEAAAAQSQAPNSASRTSTEQTSQIGGRYATNERGNEILSLLRTGRNGGGPASPPHHPTGTTPLQISSERINRTQSNSYETVPFGSSHPESRALFGPARTVTPVKQHTEFAGHANTTAPHPRNMPLPSFLKEANPALAAKWERDRQETASSQQQISASLASTAANRMPKSAPVKTRQPQPGSDNRFQPRPKRSGSTVSAKRSSNGNREVSTGIPPVPVHIKLRQVGAST